MLRFIIHQPIGHSTLERQDRDHWTLHTTATGRVNVTPQTSYGTVKSTALAISLTREQARVILQSAYPVRMR